MPLEELAVRFQEFLHDHPRLFVLTGAGVSAGSGIPEYRDENGDWKRPAPVQFHDFVSKRRTRQRYWARSLVGWPWFERARPNICHTTLAEWEATDRLGCLVTQNVDRLHQSAGSRRVIDLHGRLDRVVCLGCRAGFGRTALQHQLIARNPAFVELTAEIAPDGDAYLDAIDFDAFQVPNCPHCGGLLKPDVVFFGETVPRTRVEHAVAALRAADAMLVIGSSLMVYSGFRFCRLANDSRIPLAAITPGRTRADDLLQLKLPVRFEELLSALQPAGISRAIPADLP